MPCNYDLGGKLKGKSAKPIVLVNREGERGFDRDILRRSMGYSFLCNGMPYTPFRLNQDVVPFCSNNKDGDLAELKSGCRGEMGNPKYVNDSSDYIDSKNYQQKTVTIMIKVLVVINTSLVKAHTE